jgi:putative ABC transport system permease protein
MGMKAYRIVTVALTSTDPMTYAVVTILVVVVTLVASYVPARRAMKVDPISSLRYE